MTDGRKYYSERNGKPLDDSKKSIKWIKRLFLSTYYQLNRGGYYQKYFGIDCTDGYQCGLLGDDIEIIISFRLEKIDLYPINKYIDSYTEDDLFDVIEFMHDHCSKGIEGNFHSWNSCGMHYTKFNDEEGKKYFRQCMNPILNKYKDGFELSKSGEILILADNGLDKIFEAEIPTNDADIKKRIDLAILKFRQYKSSLKDRHDAIRDLADIFESLKTDINIHLKHKDTQAIFDIANNFEIRHHNQSQKPNYDKKIWYSWIFYFYLATLYALLHMIENDK